MLHFTPIQETGKSGSCYSIRSHDTLSPEVFSEVKRSSFSSDEEWEVTVSDFF